MRLNPTILTDTLNKLQTLATFDHRDLSHQLDALVDSEWKRRSAKKVAA